MTADSLCLLQTQGRAFNTIFKDDTREQEMRTLSAQTPHFIILRETLILLDGSDY